MKLTHLEEGDLKIDLTEEDDWKIFDHLIVDATGRGGDWLAKQMGLFVNDDDWDEFAVPEVSRQYNGQIELVAKALAVAREDADDFVGELTFDGTSGESWYGVFNQARLALEGRYKLATAEDKGEFEELESADSEKAAAYFRSRFYCFFQVQLIESVLD